MGRIEGQIKDAFDKFKEDGIFNEFLRKLLCDSDYSVRFAWQMSNVLDALKRQCPASLFECVFYDGENGVYHLLDFDPNQLEGEALRAAIEICLKQQCHIDPADFTLEDMDKFMDNVYLIDTNMMRKVRIEK